MSSGVDAIESIAEGRYQDIDGLPPRLELSAVAERYSVTSDARGAAFLGTRRAEFVAITVPGLERPITVWLDGNRVILFDARYPPVGGDLEGVIRGLGTPELRLDAMLSGLVLPEGQLVWLRRGVVLHVNPDNAQLLRAGVFEPTTAESYQERLLLDLRLTPFPRSSDPHPP